MPYFYAVGIDVSKETLDVSIITPDKLYHKRFNNTLAGIKNVSKYIKKYITEADTQVVMESTGDYHLLAAYQLGKQHNVKVINPLFAKHHMTTTVRKVKTDKVDSKLLAELGLKQSLDSHKFGKRELKKKKLVVLIDSLEKHISALKLSVSNLEKTLTQFEEDIMIVKSIKENIKKLEKNLQTAHIELAELVNNQNTVNELAATKGISKDVAVKVLSLIEDRHFDNKRALVAFCGLDVAIKQSGKWQGYSKISKRGSSQLRKYLVQIGWGLLMHNEDFQKYLSSYQLKGRAYMEILVIAARKFIRMLYGAMNSGNKFDTKYI